MTPADLQSLTDRAWDTMVGASCVDLTAETVREAVTLGGRGGTLYLCRRQAEDLVREQVEACGYADHDLSRFDGAPVVVGLRDRTINAGADWLGVYDGSERVVGICSRAGAGRFLDFYGPHRSSNSDA